MLTGNKYGSHFVVDGSGKQKLSYSRIQTQWTFTIRQEESAIVHANHFNASSDNIVIRPNSNEQDQKVHVSYAFHTIDISDNQCAVLDFSDGKVIVLLGISL